MDDIKKKFFTRGDGDSLLVEAYAPADTGGYRRILFRMQDSLDYIFEIDGETSAMVLKNGVTIPTALRFDSLRESLYERSYNPRDKIDLTLVTGKAAGDAQAVRLSTKFNPVAQEAPAESDLQITMIVHPSAGDRYFRRITVRAADIDYFEPHTGRKETETFIKMKKNTDCGSQFYAALPLPEFVRLLDHAKKSGAPHLDLCPLTAPKPGQAYHMS